MKANCYEKEFNLSKAMMGRTVFPLHFHPMVCPRGLQEESSVNVSECGSPRALLVPGVVGAGWGVVCSVRPESIQVLSLFICLL